MNDKKVLLIGGTGAIGSYALNELVRLGYSLDVITLDDCVNYRNITFYKFAISDKALSEYSITWG